MSVCANEREIDSEKVMSVSEWTKERKRKWEWREREREKEFNREIL